MEIPVQHSGNTPVRCATLGSPSGLEIDIVDFGASIAAIRVPVAGRLVDVVLTYPNLEDFRLNRFYMGATVGRYANRIANGRLRIADAVYELETHPAHCLHGGPGGFHVQRWFMDSEPSRICCRHVSSHGDQGFPGRVDVKVDYRIVNDCAVVIDYTATTDRATVVNFANHAYFNLSGESGSIDDHHLTLYASRYTPTDNELIPTGEIEHVAGTPLDFRFARPVEDDKIDANFIIDDGQDYMRNAATLYAPATGIRMELHTTQPGLQVYTADQLAAPFAPRTAICLEAQNFPDAPNQPGFPSAVLAAGDTYRQQTIYEFEVDS